MASMTAVSQAKTCTEHDKEPFALKQTTTTRLQRTNSRLIITTSLEEKEIDASIGKRQCATQPNPEIEKTYHAYFQLHHIIPQCMWTEEIGQQLQMLGFKKDDDINMVSLPTTRHIPDEIKNYSTPSKPSMKLAERAKSSSIHSGKHLASYFYYIQTNLYEILSAKIDNTIKTSNITNFLSEAKDNLLNGTLKLQQENEHEIVAYKHNKQFYFIKDEFQVHHIIPQEIFNDGTHQFESGHFKTLQEALQFIKLYKHDIQNLLALPKANALSEKASNAITPMKLRKSTDRTAHTGSHPKYTEDVRSSVIAIFKNLERELASDPEDIEIHKKAAHEALITLTQDLEKRLIDGEPFDLWGEQHANLTIRTSTTNSPILLKEDSKILTFDDSMLEITQTTTD